MNDFLKLDIIFENKDIIIINKPANLVVHPGIKHKSKTLADYLLSYCPNLKNVGNNEARFGIVHRLDKDTSGLMIIAKNQRTFENLQKQFKERKIKKTYIVLVSGIIKKDLGKIEGYMSRAKKDPRKWILKKNEDRGRYSLTEFKVLRRYKKFTLLEVYPKTGRMHQIRVHFASIGYPIVGDVVYGFKKKKRHPSLDIPRHFLHAAEIEFSLYEENFHFKTKLSSDLQNILKKI